LSQDLLPLVITAASIGFLHTLVGPDHYVPFIMMSRSGKWSLFKTGVVTVLCGIGHVLSSVVLGLIGIGVGIAVTKVEAVESFRGNLAAWALIAFGLVYLIWGLAEQHLHVHKGEGTANVTPWILFTIFVFGPCEPLIPVLMYPAAKSSAFGVALVTAVFGGVTIATMLAAVLVASWGLSLVPMERFERYSHALAGGTIFLCGMTIQFLGL
jgi:sulfite exporter TauE/SafE